MRKWLVLSLGLCLFSAPPAMAENWDAEAVALQKKSDWRGLEQLAQHWTKAEPQNAGGWLNLGLAEDGLGRRDLAAPAYEKMIELKPPPGLQQFATGRLAADYHALGQRDKLRQLAARVKAADPAQGALLLQQYAADLGPATPPAPPPLLDFVQRLTEDARRWQADAAPAAMEVRNKSDDPAAVAMDDAYEVYLTFVSPNAGQALQASFAAGYAEETRPIAQSAFSTLLPSRFIDLPAAIDRARALGMREPFDHAMLAVWPLPNRKSVPAWVIAPAHDPAFQVYVLDAQTGTRYRTEEILGPVPGNDAALLAARRQWQQAMAPPAPATAARGDNPCAHPASMAVALSPQCHLPGVARLNLLRCLGEKSLGHYAGGVAPC